MDPGSKTIVVDALFKEATAEHVVIIQGNSPDESSVSHRRQLFCSESRRREEVAAFQTPLDVLNS